jgi:glycerol-3-phosphate acyltransferase PlsY
MTDSLVSFDPALYVLVPFAYLVGSIPFGILFTKSRGVDIRSSGSRNIGATNVLRTAGKLPAVLTLLGDTLKGAVPVLICNYLIAGISHQPENLTFYHNARDLWGGIIGLTAVAGHMFSIFLSFKGGKGVATGFGVLIAYSPQSALITLLVWIGVALITKYSSLAAIVAVTCLPIILALADYSKVKIFFGLLIALLIIFRHKSNIMNLIEGKESKIGKK